MQSSMPSNILRNHGKSKSFEKKIRTTYISVGGGWWPMNFDWQPQSKFRLSHFGFYLIWDSCGEYGHSIGTWSLNSDLKHHQSKQILLKIIVIKKCPADVNNFLIFVEMLIEKPFTGKKCWSLLKCWWKLTNHLIIVPVPNKTKYFVLRQFVLSMLWE